MWPPSGTLTKVKLFEIILKVQKGWSITESNKQGENNKYGKTPRN